MDPGKGWSRIVITLLIGMGGSGIFWNYVQAAPQSAPSLYPPSGPGVTTQQLQDWKQQHLHRLASRLFPSSGYHTAAAPRANQAVSNMFVQATMSNTGGVLDNGNFGMGTTGGDPADLADDNKKLIYGWPGFSTTTYSSVYISGETFKYGDTAQGTIISSAQTTTDSIFMTWRCRNVDFTMRVTLVDSLNRRPDTAEITYEIFNNGLAKDVGMRVMLDTQVGDNDGAPINVVGRPYSAFEREFLSVNMPQFWQAYEGTPGNPGLIAQGTLFGANATSPDRFVVALWGGIYNNIWNYTINPGLNYTGDSAVAVWWNPQNLGPGESRRYTTYYGLGSGVSCENDLSVNFAAPAQLTLTNCQYVPNPFQAQVVAQNLRIFTTQNTTATLTLPPGLVFSGGSTSVINLGNIAPQAQANGSWNITATGNPYGTLRMHLEVSSQNTATCVLDWDIEIPPPCGSPTATLTPTNTPTNNPTSTPTPTPDVPTNTPTLTPTSTPTLAPTATPTPTPTPDLIPPVIRAGGYGFTDVSTQFGGHAEMYAWVEAPGEEDTTEVQVWLQGIDSGLRLYDDGSHGDAAAGDHLFTLNFGFVPPGTPPGYYLLELAAFDDNGNRSLLWPYFTITTPQFPAPEVSTFERLMHQVITRPSREFVAGQSMTRPLNGRPVIFVGGYMGETVTTDGGPFRLIAVTVPDATPIQAVELYYRLVPTGVFLSDDGGQGDFSAFDGVYGLQMSLSGPLPQLNTVLETVATDVQGNQSDVWPYLNIHDIPTDTPTPTLTPTLTPTPTMTSTPTNSPTPTPMPRCCFHLVPDSPVQTSGEYVYVDGSCSTYELGGDLEYRWNWGDSPDWTNWSRDPLANHIYGAPRDVPYTITLNVRAVLSGAECTTTRLIRIIP